jgi:hypothetical protein
MRGRYAERHRALDRGSACDHVHPSRSPGAVYGLSTYR